LVASDGTVLFDNFTDAEQMENHLNRPEIADALKTDLVKQFTFLKL